MDLTDAQVLSVFTGFHTDVAHGAFGNDGARIEAVGLQFPAAVFRKNVQHIHDGTEGTGNGLGAIHRILGMEPVHHFTAAGGAVDHHILGCIQIGNPWAGIPQNRRQRAVAAAIFLITVGIQKQVLFRPKSRVLQELCQKQHHGNAGLIITAAPSVDPAITNFAGGGRKGPVGRVAKLHRIGVSHEHQFIFIAFAPPHRRHIVTVFQAMARHIVRVLGKTFQLHGRIHGALKTHIQTQLVDIPADLLFISMRRKVLGIDLHQIAEQLEQFFFSVIDHCKNLLNIHGSASCIFL